MPGRDGRGRGRLERVPEDDDRVPEEERTDRESGGEEMTPGQSDDGSGKDGGHTRKSAGECADGVDAGKTAQSPDGSRVVPMAEYDELARAAGEFKKQADDLLNRIKYLQAEFDNYKKWAAKDKAEFAKVANERLVLSILPIIDAFEKALEGGRAEKSPFRDGMALLYNDLVAKLKGVGLEPVVSVGSRFDPYRHEAIYMEARPDLEDGTVLEELQKGYLLNGKLVRTAKVKISRLPDGGPDPNTARDNGNGAGGTDGSGKGGGNGDAARDGGEGGGKGR